MSMDKKEQGPQACPVAIVTGASAGLGDVYARKLAERGFDLIVVARREDRLNALKEELEGRFGITVEPVVADLANEEAVAKVATGLRARNNIELLVNNAGFGVQGTFHQADLDKNLAMIRVHVFATVSLTHAVLPQMVARNRGGVINVSSLASFLTAPGAVSYCATKAYLNSFSKSVQAELHGTDVRIQALCPGFTYTEFHDVPDAEMDRSTIPRFMWMQADRVAEISLRSLKRGKVLCIPGVVNRILAWVMRSHLFDPFIRRAYGKRKKGC